MRAIELFAGAGGAALGLRAAGVEALACVEYDKDACSTLEAAGFPSVCADVHAYAWDGEAPDLVWASFPCQCWSTAGKRLGARDTERNGWPWTVDQVDALSPTWLICENVPGLTFHSADGCGDPMLCPRCYFDGVILPQLRERFASVQWAILDAADFGVPQFRRRVFIVAGPRPIAWPEPTHGKPDELGLFSTLKPWVTVRDALGLSGLLDGSRNSEANPNQERPSDTDTEPSPAVNGKGNQMFDPRHPPNTPDKPAGTIRSGGSGHDAPPQWLIERPSPTVTTTEEKGSRCGHGSGGPNNFDRASDMLWRATGRRRLTVTECATLQNFPDGYPFAGNKGSQYRQIGNAVPPKLAEVVARAVLSA